MPFKRYVEIGRVALVNFGADEGQLTVIVDVVDQNRALCDFPNSVRQVIPFKRLSITDLKVDIARSPLKKTLKAAVESAGVVAKFSASSWGQKLAKRASKAASSDFDRFKTAVALSKKSRAIRTAVNKLKKSA
uniref:Putative 60S ribosomal protein L14 n=1 Tax=Polytomella sp. Pringsheim 198.80 TaxID=37502 RepID=A0A024FSJ4_9CHLO|nr:putative 60S ribosomal protein L14 [Polytomella sp. Pringsheim 198.80]|mmetsp:Transcript_3279/g.5455  ORF Transcript_3279/g.5455 Transcript_3279/m.5455 type:complete len:133 (-) Transcript_3279:97-495(-)|eukprot:CAMPEP_0175038712 /NCGR_PEP_ID=MMETSP0052_2-20121109/32_1 /TAXON_ID=51329 ORGANISM="Polytomella parva, Strain SAG 63-3" /NCGR_SAMPLE_ID=MMETSP0052_2 /ASSEMBLY_ACC=CAM_ASM_000194 /LENGTH=132 /DNA_ID=CAMNT_0016300187 /DNA_START=725 /DNA_END=1123 /DNA_ORIENTATION=+